MRKLFLSVSGTARAIHAGAVTEDDLNAGLFCLSIMTPAEIRDEPRCSPAALARLADAVERALAEGRCVLFLSDEARAEPDYNEYRLINRLLAAHGCAPISDAPADERMRYRQGAVAARVQGLDVLTSRWGIGSEDTQRLQLPGDPGDTLE